MRLLSRAKHIWIRRLVLNVAFLVPKLRIISLGRAADSVIIFDVIVFLLLLLLFTREFVYEWVDFHENKTIRYNLIIP